MSSSISVLLPLVAFMVLAIAFVVVLRRASRLLSETRAQEQFRVVVDEIVAVEDAALEQIARRIDAVRRHDIPASEIEAELAATIGLIRLQAARMPAPTGRLAVDEVRARLVGELDRAERALGLVAHGCSILETSRGGPRMEGQTALKRGYLGILHAREAMTRHVADIGPRGVAWPRAVSQQETGAAQDASEG